jgi:hypothetical protein
MQVNRVTATVRYSQDTGKGAWKSLELGCDASIDPKEDWQKAQASLYGQLAQQFKTLWSQNGTAPEHALEGRQIDAQAPTTQSNPERWLADPGALVPPAHDGVSTPHWKERRVLQSQGARRWLLV